jgi:hypothetical protein
MRRKMSRVSNCKSPRRKKCIRQLKSGGPITTARTSVQWSCGQFHGTPMILLLLSEEITIGFAQLCKECVFLLTTISSESFCSLPHTYVSFSIIIKQGDSKMIESYFVTLSKGQCPPAIFYVENPQIAPIRVPRCLSIVGDFTLYS